MGRKKGKIKSKKKFECEYKTKKFFLKIKVKATQKLSTMRKRKERVHELDTASARKWAN